MDAEDYNHCLFGYKLSESLVECFEARVDSCHCGLWLWTSFRGTTWMHPTGRAMRYDKKVGFPPYPVASLKVDKESYWTCNPLGDWHDWHDWHPGWGGRSNGHQSPLWKSRRMHAALPVPRPFWERMSCVRRGFGSDVGIRESDGTFLKWQVLEGCQGQNTICCVYIDIPCIYIHIYIHVYIYIYLRRTFLYFQHFHRRIFFDFPFPFHLALIPNHGRIQVVQAKSGMGKTAVFVLACLQQVDSSEKVRGLGEVEGCGCETQRWWLEHRFITRLKFESFSLLNTSETFWLFVLRPCGRWWFATPGSWLIRSNMSSSASPNTFRSPFCDMCHATASSTPTVGPHVWWVAFVGIDRTCVVNKYAICIFNIWIFNIYIYIYGHVKGTFWFCKLYIWHSSKSQDSVCA